MGFEKPSGHTSSLFDSRLQTFAGFPRARSTHDWKKSPLWLATKTLGELDQKDRELKELTNDEVELSFRLTERQRQHAGNLLERQKAEKTVTLIDATWYDISQVCATLPAEAQESCGHLEVRVRSQTNEQGVTKWFWAIKRNGNPDGITRPETQDVADTREQAYADLKAALQHMLNLKEPPALETPSLQLTKKRTSYRFANRELDDGEEPKCVRSEIDIDEWVTLQGQSLNPPVITIDIEGPSAAAIESCRRCLQEHLPPPEDKEDVWKEWRMSDILDEYHLPGKRK